MDENNTPKNNPKNKKSLGMLIMILALVLVAVILVIVIVASTGGNDDTTASTTTTAPDTSSTAPDSSSTTTPDSSSTTPDSSSTATPDSSSTPAVTITPVTPTTEVADATGKVTVNSEEAANGLLISINSENPYQYQVDKLFKGDQNTPKADVEAAGFIRFAQNDVMQLSSGGYNHFLRKEAFEALAAMINAFDAVAGTDRPFLASGYTATTAATNTLVSGNVVWLRIYENDLSYNFDNVGKKITVDGTAMTYEAWFKANCAKFGFVYEGLVGQAGEFRYVGSVHSTGIAEKGSLNAYLTGVKDGSIKTVTAADGTVWNLSYVEASNETTTEITVGANATYTVSGDNMGGFVVAVKAESSAN